MFSVPDLLNHHAGVEKRLPIVTTENWISY